MKKCEPEPNLFAAGDRVQFRARRIPAALKHRRDTVGTIVDLPEGQAAPMGGLVYAEFPIIGRVWISPGDLERVERE